MRAERVLSGLYRLLAGILMIFCFGLAAAGLFFTISFRQFEQNDYPDLVSLTPIVSGAALLVALGLLWFLMRRGGPEARTLKGTGVLIPDGWFLCALIWALGLSAILILVIGGLPTNDARQIDEILHEFERGEYGAIRDGYFACYPFQLCYAFLCERMTGVFGAGNYAPYQWGNVLSILISLFFLYEITWELTGSVRACRALSLLSFFNLYFYVYSTFIYNDIWPLAPLYGALYFLIRYLKGGGIGNGLLAAVLAALSWVVKTNGLIALIAMGIATAGAALGAMAGREKAEKRVLGCAAVLALLAVLPFVLRHGVNGYYEERSGEKISSGVPAMAYLAMGMTDSDGKYGWYNGDNVHYLQDNDMDPGAASAAAWPVVRGRIAFFATHPKAFLQFYGMKFFTQWGDPTAVSLREQELTSRHQELSAQATALVSGTGYRILGTGMQISHLLRMFLAGLGLFLLLRRYHGKQIPQSVGLLLLFVFGGMAFHELWEASGRYTLRYTLALLPFAAIGLEGISHER